MCSCLTQAVSIESPWKGLLVVGLWVGISLWNSRQGACSLPTLASPTKIWDWSLFPACVGLWLLGCVGTLQPILACRTLLHIPQISAANEVNSAEGAPRQGDGTQLGVAVPTPPPCPSAKSRSIALPMDLDAHVSSLLNSSSTSTVQRNTSSYKAATRTFPRVSTTPNQWDYKNIIEKLQVRGRAWQSSGGRRALAWQGPSAVCPWL